MVINTFLIHNPIMQVKETAADDDSTSSTILVSGIKRPLEKTTVTKRHVHFAEEPTYIESQHEDKSECREGWYSARDYKIFRSAIFEAAQQIIKTEQRNRAPHSYDRVMTRIYELCKSSPESFKNDTLPSKESVHLERWMEVASSRIGLERWAVRSISTDKAVRRTALNECVKHNQSAKHHLGMVCERLSRPSVLFARSLAQAQAAAVQKESFFQ